MDGTVEDWETKSPAQRLNRAYALAKVPQDKIVSAFRKASLLVHPDKAPEDPDAAAAFRKVLNK